MPLNARETIEYNKHIIQKCFDDVWNDGKLDVVGELVHQNFVRHHERNQDEDLHGIVGFQSWVSVTRRAFPDLQMTIEQIFCESDRVMAHLHGKGTHRGDLKGLSATGTELEWTATTIIRLLDGKIVECWAIADTLGLLQRLGQIPPLA
jgi:predicted ester cyclase